MSIASDQLPYRPCAGIMLANRDGRIFVGQRRDSSSEAWQMPQGGIDPGEDSRSAALRELHEETGIAPELVTIIAQSAEEYFYDLPDHLQGRMWGGQYRGQRQIWYLMRFNGQDSDINIITEHQEFRAWKWADLDSLESLIVPFKQKLYRALVDEFRSLV